MATKTSKIVFQKDVRDFTTGEIVSSQTESYVENEPDYIKLYLADLMSLADIPKSVTGVLLELLKLTNYNNEIVLNGYIKKTIAEKAEVAIKTVDNSLSSLLKSKILFKKGSGTFIANPFLFGKGNWKDIKKMRLTVDYSPSGRTLRAEIDKGTLKGRQINLEDILKELAVDQAA